MGLDTVELIMRTEEVFEVDLPDEECGRVQTVGDLYRLVLTHLELPYVPSREIESQVGGFDRSRATNGQPWIASDVWLTLKAVVSNQLQVDIRDIHEEARFQDDLRCD